MRHSLLLLFAVVVSVAACSTQPPNPCEGFAPACDGNVAVNCVNEHPCDVCSYQRSIVQDSCDSWASISGVSKTCMITVVKTGDNAFCVDSPEVSCGQHQPGQEWCDSRNHLARCYQTAKGPLVFTDAVSPVCPSVTGP
jgi:hypothetical protein